MNSPCQGLPSAGMLLHGRGGAVWPVGPLAEQERKEEEGKSAGARRKLAKPPADAPTVSLQGSGVRSSRRPATRKEWVCTEGLAEREPELPKESQLLLVDGGWDSLSRTVYISCTALQPPASARECSSWGLLAP